ncbi:M14 family zinc carboxypeptidase [Kocuria rosea]|uniref:M14 family zinc carboxypeptidase n=1 Tax=Kocuria rosea TaxID=1275 RepID=UPI002040E4CA|nr:M14 family zinc carboxypeptidase [Kocuria rosea]MCM3689236.1 Tat (twin-arginine translocation) pathway signal sequence [Kocuria rosea]
MTPQHLAPAPSRSSRLLAAEAALAVALPLGAAAPAADANFPSAEGRTSISSILTYDDVVQELQQLERTGRYGVDAFTLAEAGMTVSTSEQGRDLWVATVGSGEEHVWLQGRIHGNEPYGTDALLALLRDLGTNGSPEYELLREKFTFHVIPMYNPDGAEANIRHTVLWDQVADAPQDGTPQRVDLNRDWTPTGFAADESLAFYEYWTTVDPAWGIDIHHQGLKQQAGTGDDVTLSLGISLAPGGPTLPGIRGGAYDVLTRQMHVHVYDELAKYGSITMDRYQVGGSYEIDIKGGVVSAMMTGLDHGGMNPEGHSNPVVFFETSGNTSDGSLGQRARGKSIRQNVLAVKELLLGVATGEVQEEDPERWEEIPHQPVTGYSTDYAGTIPVG